ncbi:hypothetical protein [Brevibacterium samyangense]|uniref:Glycosyl transferases group 1 n=1 Tax=Brevibacterium samyangense TaxID=366888 RepID=A0ABP5ELY9_9MICO
MIESGLGGRLVPLTRGDEDVAAIAEALVATLTDPRLDDMRAHNLRRAEEYSADAVRRRWEDLFRDGTVRSTDEALREER